MIKTIDRRCKSLEIMRNNLLKGYFEKESIEDSIFDYFDLNMLSKSTKIKKNLYNAVFKSKYDENIILHPQQVECLSLLDNNDNLLISAPTSFGKTYVALEYIVRKKPKNVVFVVPTLALMHEIFIKCVNKFIKEYTIIKNSYETMGEKNIIILVPERVNLELLSKIEEVDLMVFDEIYKLNRQVDKTNNIDKRLIQMNKGYFNLVERSKKILLLGPFIKDVIFQNTKLSSNIVKYYSDYSPVYVKIEYHNPSEKDDFICNEIKDKTNGMIYFYSPYEIHKFGHLLCENIDECYRDSLVAWCEKNISADWLPVKLLKRKIGVHYGSLPIFIRNYIERIYKTNKITNILCTSTLLEGVNTPTFNLYICDDNLTPFRLNNLIGRVGRLGENMPGHVWYFNRKYDDWIIGEDKYETLNIVAEDSLVSSVEEVIYLGKDIKQLDGELLKKVNIISNKMKKYNKSFEDLKNIENLHVDEFEKLLDNIDFINKELMEILDKINTSEEKEIKKTTLNKGKILDKMIEIVPIKDSFLKSYNGKCKKDEMRRKESSIINALIRKNTSYYKKIENAIRDFPDKNYITGFIDFVFSMMNSYIKYDLSRLVSYFDFLFDEKYEGEFKIKVMDKYILSGIRKLNFDDDKISACLFEIGIPPSDIKELKKILKCKEEEISSAEIIELIRANRENIDKSKKIDDLTKELIIAYL